MQEAPNLDALASLLPGSHNLGNLGVEPETSLLAYPPPQPYPTRRGGSAAALDNKEDVLRSLARTLVIPVSDGRTYKAPIITLSNETNSNLYTLVERHLRPEFTPGAERWWKIIRSDQGLDTWRPRVHGIQLKALQNCRLPEHEDELEAAEAEIHAIRGALRSDTSPELFISELRGFIGAVEVWWESRNSRRPTADPAVAAGAQKRSAAATAAYMPPVKQHQPSRRAAQGAGGSNQGNHRLSLEEQAPPASAGLGQAGMFGSSAPLTFPTSFPGENGLVQHANTSSAPLELTLGNGAAADLGMLMRGTPGPFLANLPPPLPPPGPPADPGQLVHLNVGGKPFATTTGTLLAAPNSYFWSLLGTGPQGEPAHPLRNAQGEVFIDRSGKLFPYILEFLRSLASHEPTSPLPEDANTLAALAREAEFYQLPLLLDRISQTAIMPQPNTRSIYDSIYLETGFNSIEGPCLKEMEQRKVVVMQQMNHVLAQKALDGFHVSAADCGVNHRDTEDGMQHNLFYHILLKRVMPTVPSMGQQQQQQQHHQQEQQPQLQFSHQQGGGESDLQRQLQVAALAYGQPHHQQQQQHQHQQHELLHGRPQHHSHPLHLPALDLQGQGQQGQGMHAPMQQLAAAAAAGSMAMDATPAPPLMEQQQGQQQQGQGHGGAGGLGLQQQGGGGFQGMMG